MQLELETAERLLVSVAGVREKLAKAPTTEQLARSLRRLTKQLVSDLLPLLAAEETVLDDYVQPDLCCDLKSTNRKLRSSIERMEMVTDGVERSRRRIADLGPARSVLRETAAALACSVEQQRAACRQLDGSLSPSDRDRLAQALGAAATAARSQTMLIIQPVIPSRASTVLRKRPDLDVAYALSLAAIERSAGPIQTTENGATMDTPSTPHGGRP